MLRSLSITSASTLVAVIAHFVTFLILVRVIDEHAMGIYFMALLCISVLMLISDFGLDMSFVKIFPELSKRSQTSLLFTAFLQRFALCAAATALFLVFIAIGGGVLPDGLPELTLGILALYWQQRVRTLLFRILQSRQMFNAVAASQAGGAILKSALISSLLLMDEVTLLYVLAIENVAFLSSILYASWRIRSEFDRYVSPSWDLCRRLLVFGWPIQLNAVVNVGNDQANHYIVAILGGPVSLAYLSVAERLADATRRILDSFLTIYYPTITKYFATDDRQASIELTNKSMLWLTLITGGGAVVFCIISDPLIILLFTERYAVAADAALLFFVALMFRSIHIVMGYFGVAAGQNFLPINVSALSSVLNIGLTIALFQEFGFEGAVVALVTTQVAMCFLYYFGLRRAGFALDVRPICKLAVLVLAALGWVYWTDGSWISALLAPPALLVAALATSPELRSDVRMLAAKTRAKLGERRGAAE